MSQVIPFKAIHVYIEELVYASSENDGHFILKYVPEVGVWYCGVQGITDMPIETTGLTIKSVVLNVWKQAGRPQRDA